MTMERAQKLIDLGFDWSTTDPRHVSWEDRYEQLKEFYVSVLKQRNGLHRIDCLSISQSSITFVVHTYLCFRKHMDTQRW